MNRTDILAATFRSCVIIMAFCLLNFGLQAASPIDQQKRASANNEFAFKLLKQLANDQPGRNIFISPYSVATALQMVGNGARGQTLAEMQQVLGTTGIRADMLNEANRDFAKWINGGRNTNVILTTANAIWYRQGTLIKPEFSACNQEFFGATVAALDFNDPRSVGIINAWASDKTHGRINGIADGMIDPATELFLANAVYFKGKWEVPFDVKGTKERVFHLRGSGQRKVPMMEQTRKFMYREGTGYQAVQLPYQGWDLAMYVFLPAVGSSTEKLLGILNGDKWQRVTEPGFSEREGTVVLPKFKLEYAVELKPPLRALGMKAAFADADFSGISSHPLFISAVRQKTFVEVNEEGTEAAAVTGIAAAKMGIEMNPPKPFAMIVDRPFLFLIEARETKTILFMGLVVDP